MSYLGIDAGSSYIKFWHEDESGSVIDTLFLHHKGAPLKSALSGLVGLRERPKVICVSGLGDMDDATAIPADGLLAEVASIKESYPQRAMLVFGAQTVEFVRFDDKGCILEYHTNASCAAGTGSFLDEQASRLGLDLSRVGSIPILEDAPLVATRCAVFAKTDLIHLQQEGYSAEAMYNGLCRGLVISSLKSVFGGRLPDGDGIVATGGLLANPHFRHFLSRMCPRITVAHNPAFTRARGLCLLARRTALAPSAFHRSAPPRRTVVGADQGTRPLVLEKSSFPGREIARKTDFHGNEVWHELKGRGELACSLGIDIGSTSTKAVLVDGSGRIVLDIYTRTLGNPLEATRRIFAGILDAASGARCSLRISSCATTGSGRKLVGIVVGADLIVNEISAHAKGALSLDPNVRTIFEIGGQDAKFIRLENGRIVDVNMNYVCAAGTGSFVEEQAKTLGMELDEIGDVVMGVTPLPNSDRCTVFMNQEITRQLASGMPRERIMAGVLVAVFRNYITKVVGTRPYARDSIVFQGATARNKGLVAALEQLTGARVLVSPFCHVMGAYGAALLAQEKRKPSSSFKGFTIGVATVRESTCRGCENACRITHVESGGGKTSWGHLCGKEVGDTSRGRRENAFVAERNRIAQRYASPYLTGKRPAVKMPALGLNDEFAPYVGEVLNVYGLDLEVVRPSRAEVASELASFGTGDFCYPVKVAMASARAIQRKSPSSLVCMPHLIQDNKNPSIHPRSLYCPFISALPCFVRPEEKARSVIAPVIDLNSSIEKQAASIQLGLAEAGLFSTETRLVREAVRRGIELVEAYRQELARRLCTLLEERDEGRGVIVLFGRPYNLYHPVLNLGIPELVESLGYTVVTLDAVPDDVGASEVCTMFPDVYWAQGLKILRKAISVRRRAHWFPLLITNFSCGPDSFLLTYFEEICRGKPYLILELDEHGSATGYQTRIEAFFDMIEQHRPGLDQGPPSIGRRRIRYRLNDVPAGATLWIPQIHPYTPQLWSAVLASTGIDARPLGHETAAECTYGRSLCRGSECLPAAVTTGRFISEIESSQPEGKLHCLFMPRAEGPCRFGQYATLQSLVIERKGINGALIFSPTSEDGYAFLDRSTELAVWEALCLGDALYKLRCRIVPYHDRPEEAQTLIDEALAEICDAIRRGKDWKDTARALGGALGAHTCIERPGKPLVGIVGEIFVRMNLFSNQDVVKVVEKYGGEAWLSPMSEWVHYVWRLLSLKSSFFKGLLRRLKARYLHHVEQSVMGLFSPVLDDRHEPPIDEVLDKGKSFIPVAFEGESILTLGRAMLFAEGGARLIVNCSPFGCMPGRITSYLFQTFAQSFRVPVVNVFFDGTGEAAEQVGVYLRSLTHGDEPTCQAGSVFRRPPAAPPPARRGGRRLDAAENRGISQEG